MVSLYISSPSFHSQLTRRSLRVHSFLPIDINSSRFDSLVLPRHLPHFFDHDQNDEEGSWEDDRLDLYPSRSYYHPCDLISFRQIVVGVGQRIGQQSRRFVRSFELDSTSISFSFLDFDSNLYFHLRQTFLGSSRCYWGRHIWLRRKMERVLSVRFELKTFGSFFRQSPR